jgi:MFS family permease
MGSSTLVTAGILLAVVAAIRSTWSPCGISMLSTLTPLGERSRGHRYPVTVGWFVAGGVLGGATLGGLAAALGYVVGRLSPSERATAVVVAVAAVITILSDLGLGVRLPTVPRQVNEAWTGRYRGWAYAGGFGWQIGVGLSTYVMTAAVYLAVVVAALTGRPAVAFLIGVTFGALRGLAILLGVGLQTPAAIRAFHRRFEAAAAWSAALAVLAQVAVLSMALGVPGVLTVAVVVAAAGCGAALRRARSSRPVRRSAEPSSQPVAGS